MQKLLVLVVAPVPFTQVLGCSPAPAPQAPMAEAVSVAPVRETALPPRLPAQSSTPGAPANDAPESGPPSDSTMMTSPADSDAAAAGGPPLDRGAAARALMSVDVQPCISAGGGRGAGHVTLTFAPDGRVIAAVVDGGPLAGTSTATCVVERFRPVTVPPFSGPEVRVGRSFFIR